MKRIFTSVLATVFALTTQFAQAQFSTNGDASDISTSTNPNSFLLTKNRGQKGNVWNNSKLDLKANSFTLSFSLRFDNKVNKGSDGIGLVLQNDSRGTQALSNNTGSQYMGFFGIQPALNIEFDTYNDGTAVGDIAADHISISKSNAASNVIQLTQAISAKANNATIEDGLDHKAEIIWDAANTTLEVYLDGSLRLTYSGDFVKEIFNGNSQVVWGITSTSGDNGKRNQVSKIEMTTTPASKSISPLPVSLVNFAVAKTDAGNKLTWSTASEKNSAYFQVERSADAKNWTALTKINSHGNSNNVNNYNFTDATAAAGLTYYRLKMVDLDETAEFSNIISVQSANFTTASVNVFPNPVQNTEALNITLEANGNEAVAITLLDMTGNIVKIEKQSALSGNNTFSLSLNSVKPGMYLVQVSNGTSKETIRVVVR